jgi:hypothetical protein
MRSPRLPFAAFVLAVLATACASPSPGAARQDAGSPPTATPATPTPAKRRSEPTPRVAEPDEPPKTPDPPLLGRDHRSVVACTADADCGWDDTCMPTRCVEHGPMSACDESMKPPGTCTCLEGACTLKPDTPPAQSGTCEPRACMLDRAAGKCVADDGGIAESVRSTPGVEVGPSCDCIELAKGCVFTWFDPVPCTTDRDCWVDPSPRRHPVARPKPLRKRDFRPCADGEVPPKCGPQGRCILGPAYSC